MHLSLEDGKNTNGLQKFPTNIISLFQLIYYFSIQIIFTHQTHFDYRSRLRKYWLKGEKAGTTELFTILPGFPDNVRTNDKGEFWVAIHCRRSTLASLQARYPKLRKFMLKLPISAKIQFLLHIGGWPHGVLVKYSPEGKLLQILEDSQGKVVKAASEVEEKDGKLWIGSVLMSFVAVYNLH